VDHREYDDVWKALRSVGASPQRVTLENGDISTDKVCIEFKRARDFVDSVFDRRLDRQLPKMPYDRKACWLLIAGTLEDLSDRQKARFKENTMWGALGSMAYRYGINVIWIYRPLKEDGMKMAMYVAHKICSGVAEGKLGRRRYPSKYVKKKAPAGVEAIRKAYGVPVKVAFALHRKFKNLAGVASATKAQLQGVTGVGPVRAKLIYSLSRT